MANRDDQARLGATDSGPRPGRFPLGSAQSRAAARAILGARKASEAEEEWDKEFDLTGLAERLAAARQCNEHRAVPWADMPPIHIPPGKENTLRGRLAARLNAANARMARFEAEEKAELPVWTAS
jgi:hypothetical protein